MRIQKYIHVCDRDISANTMYMCKWNIYIYIYREVGRQAGRQAGW